PERNIRMLPGSNPKNPVFSHRGEQPAIVNGSSMKQVRVVGWADVGGREAALIQRCASGEEEACAELVNEHQRMVVQLAMNLLSDRNEALDLSQEGLLRVFRPLPSFRGQASLRTWIYRIAVNQARNRHRFWRRRHHDD